MKHFTTALIVFLMLCTLPLQAAVTLESFTFVAEADEHRFKELIGELRCLVCQNQTLLDSDAELAHDLRAEVYDMMQDERSNEEIIEFLVARYGDFVLYSPPVKPSTYLLWFGPFILLLIAAFLMVRAVRHQKHLSEPELSAADQRQLKKILDEPASKTGDEQ